MNYPYRNCAVCGRSFQLSSWVGDRKIFYCSDECRKIKRMKSWKIVSRQCVECGKIVELRGREGLQRSGNKHFCCGDECKKACFAKIYSETMAQTNRKYASHRMKVKNPMFDPIAKEKACASNRLRDWRPPVQGGNGKTPPVAQLLMASTLKVKRTKKPWNC